MARSSTSSKLSRRQLLKGLAGSATALAAPTLWLPTEARAQTSGRGSVRHLLYLRLADGFRFTCAFNGAVGDSFNPYGLSSLRAPGTEWGPSTLLDSATWLQGAPGTERANLGMRRLSEISNEIAVLPCVDHEPYAARADGNHGTALERFLTGYVGGPTSFLTFVNHGVRARVAAAAANRITLLPAFSLGESGMASGAGVYAQYRAPVLAGEGLTGFVSGTQTSLPAWASNIAARVDARMGRALAPTHRPQVESYQRAREATRAYGEIFQSPILAVANRSAAAVDGISNAQLELLFGTDRTARRIALALRLFHFGCPAAFVNQGAYDLHSGEESELPRQLDELNRLMSGLNVALKLMQHPEGGTYWDRTLVVLGSEFGRTASGQRFNSARGSDHNSDLPTRWMSMPLMGGVIQAAGKGGRQLGATRASDLAATGKVYSYRSVLKTMLDLLGADHAGVFPADPPIEDLFT